MADILNYFKVSESLATSGQPTVEQFGFIAEGSYEVVINLAMPNSDNAIPNEGEIVSSNGMSYIHIPVSWENPQISDLILFCNIMKSIQKKKVWVHCAKNMRVSCFVYLYQKHVLKLPDVKARYPMDKIWSPDGVWAELIVESENAL